MNILSFSNITKSYGVKTLFKDLSFHLGDSDKIGLIGINGTGKSSLLRIIAGQDTPDSGERLVLGDKRIAYLSQLPEMDPEKTVLDQVFSADLPEMVLLRDYEATLFALEKDPEDRHLQDKLLKLSARLDGGDLWNLQSQVKTILMKLGIRDFDKKIGTHSGGEKKRIALATALLVPSDLLILDEPTNHLDNTTIDWLETYLAARKGALLMVTHDRYFLDRVVNKTLELDHGQIYEYEGNYSQFLEKKAERLAHESALEEKRQNLYRRELAWMRRGARARTTKQKARIQRFEAIENAGPTNYDDTLSLDVAFTRLGKTVIEMEHIAKAFDDLQVIDDFSYTFGKDERIGIVGPNGRGKTTLLNLIAQKFAPDQGLITIGDTVKIGYFSQGTDEMDPGLRAIEYIREGAETATTADGSVITAAQMMERFLFDRDAQWVYISELSGGEKRRLYLLRVLMSAPNVLLFDEPTNDLDIETLTVLENYLDEFPGCVLTVSHDRYFLDRTCDTIFAFLGGGEIRIQTGNYSDYRKKYPADENGEGPAPEKPKAAPPTERKKNNPVKLSYKEKIEFEEIDAELAKLEAKLEEIEEKIPAAATDYSRLYDLTREKDEVEELLLEKMERREVLEKKNQGIEV